MFKPKYNENNLILNIDSYNASHLPQYPEGTKYVSAYIESRGGEYDKVLFFGLQAFIQNYLMKPITMHDIQEAKEVLLAHGEPFSQQQEDLWIRIVNQYNGYLPIKITAVKEGTVVDTHNVLVQITNTNEDYFWLPSYIETMILRGVWYPTTVATVSKTVKNIIMKYLDKTSDNPDAQIAFKLHDFGARGVSSLESAKIGGSAHLVNFMGTDTVPALLYVMNNYDIGMPGFSIPAAAHHTITSWGKSNEAKAYRNMIEKFGGQGRLVAVVSDSYDIFNAVDNIWGKELKAELLASGTTLVVRPDSGKPSEIVLAIAQSLEKSFGVTINSKGYKVLHPSVRIIQGDGVNPVSIEEILSVLERHGFSAENVAFGMGGALLQQLDRDTQKFAQKVSAVSFDSVNYLDVYKDPVTDKVKKSKRGIQKLIKVGDHFQTVKADESEAIVMDYLEPVFENGQLLRVQTFQEIRDLSNAS